MFYLGWKRSSIQPTLSCICGAWSPAPVKKCLGTQTRHTNKAHKAHKQNLCASFITDAIRLLHVLVFCDAPPQQVAASQTPHITGRRLRLTGRINWCTAVVVVYALGIVLNGLLANKYVQLQLKLLWRKCFEHWWNLMGWELRVVSVVMWVDSHFGQG